MLLIVLQLLLFPTSSTNTDIARQRNVHIYVASARNTMYSELELVNGINLLEVGSAAGGGAGGNRRWGTTVTGMYTSVLT